MDWSKLKQIADNILTYYQTTNFRLFQTERVCRRQFQIWRKWKKVIQTGRKHCGKGEIARYEQFLLFPQCFHKICFPEASKGVIVWEWVIVHLKWKWSAIREENIVRKEEIACCKQFLLFSQCFPQLYIWVCQNAALCGNGIMHNM